MKNKKSNHLTAIPISLPVWLFLVSSLWLGAVPPPQPVDTQNLKTGNQIYMTACATCHGHDGRGVTRSLLGFDQALPDFTDCEFSNREPESDWVIVAFHGGPVKGFSRFMPAFGRLLTRDQLLLAIRYIKKFCRDKKWPRGELNLPKALVTEKAFPEDEVIFSTTADKGFSTITNKFVYETRFGSQNQIEISIPFGWYKRDIEPQDTSLWSANLGDLALGYKRVLFHNYRMGSILSLVGEVLIPTGDEADGFGKGTVVVEPFLVFSQILPGDFFMHAQAAIELPLNHEKGENEGIFRLALGRSFAFKQDGRQWSPMIEILASRELESGKKFLYDIVPQIQIALNKRQHIRFNIGVRIPMNETQDRDFQILAYLLWDWFDGGFFEGW